jgi:ABC-type uncharacterized transport system substrate-binding protein
MKNNQRSREPLRGKKLSIYLGVSILIVAILIGGYFAFFYSSWKFTEDRPIKIFFLHSYHPEFPSALVEGYTLGFEQSFEEALEKKGIEVETKTFYMDFIRKPEEGKKEAAREAKKLIDEFKPDLIFASDDPAQEFVIMPYYLNTDVPVVALAVNKEPETYNFVGARNIAVVLEREHFASSIELLKELFSHIKKIGVIISPYPQWKDVFENLEEASENMPEVEFVGWDIIESYSDFQSKVIDYQDKVDALLLSPPVDYRYENGSIVSMPVAIQWVAENSNIPEITLWDVIEYGFLGAVVVSPNEQGKAAGKIGYDILINGKKPSSFDFKSTEKGKQMINLARAKTLDLEIPSAILINSQVYEEFPWEEQE